MGTEEPYEKGHYYGILTLPDTYPYKAPRIIMNTPNGRFKTDTRLCFSMSDYHQETWSPNWNIRTIMIGFYSFMLEESQTDAHVNGSKYGYTKYASLKDNLLDESTSKKVIINNELNRIVAIVTPEIGLLDDPTTPAI